MSGDEFQLQSLLPASLSARGQQLLLILLACVFSAAYVGLALYGWGWHNWRGFFDSLPRSGVCIGMGALFIGTFAFGCNVSTGQREEPGNDWIFLPMSLAGLAMGWVAPHDDRREVLTLTSTIWAYLGFALFWLGTLLRIAAIRILGPRHSVWVAIQEGHSLVTTGLYRLIRHPSYLGALLAVFGWALAFRSIVGLVLAALFIPPIVSRMNAEERLLLHEFPREYSDYRQRSWRLLPFVW